MDILNLGCGNRIIASDASRTVVNHDVTQHRPEIDVAWNLSDMPWPWADESFDLITAWSVLEHLPCTLFVSMDECWRLLRPGGMLDIKLPYWKHAHAFRDPSHYWQCDIETLDYFDPETKIGREYAFYTTHKWQFVTPTALNKAQSSIAAKLEKRS